MVRFTGASESERRRGSQKNTDLKIVCLGFLTPPHLSSSLSLEVLNSPHTFMSTERREDKKRRRSPSPEKRTHSDDRDSKRSKREEDDKRDKKDKDHHRTHEKDKRKDKDKDKDRESKHQQHNHIEKRYLHFFS
jgi:hypothetical protein